MNEDMNGTKRTNRFIFTDDYYDNLDNSSSDSKTSSNSPLGLVNNNSNSNNNDNFNTTENTNQFDFVYRPQNDVSSTSSMEQVVNNDYSNSDDNYFNGSKYNTNTQIQEEPVTSPSVSEQSADSGSKNNTKKNFFDDFGGLFKEKKERLKVVKVGEPVSDRYQGNNDNNSSNNFYEMPDSSNLSFLAKIDNTPSTSEVNDSSLSSDSVNASEQPVFNSGFEVPQYEPVTSVSDIPANQVYADTSSVSQEKEENNSSIYSIDSGVNTELEKELMLQKQMLDEEEKKEEYRVEYSDFIPREPQTEMIYKAGGKSIIREKQEKPIRKIEYTFPGPVPVEEPEVPSVVDIDKELENKPQSVQEMIEQIVGVSDLEKKVVIDTASNPGVSFGTEEKLPLEDEVATEETIVYDEKKDNFDYDQNFDNVTVTKSTLLDELAEKSSKDNTISILSRYGEDFCARDYITNPAIGRAEEIKQLILILLTPEKSGILVGKPGIGKTSIVEGLAYQLQRNNVPDALKGYTIVSVKTPSLLGSLPTGETRLQTLVDELKKLDKIILFIDEIHMLIGATSDSSMDFANMFKESLGRGSIKIIGATTTEEYERYVLRDKAFVRRFQRVDVLEPNREMTIKILMGTLPKIEKNTGAKLKYTAFIQSEIMAFIVDITTEYKRIYGIGSRYPDICLTLLSQAFSQAVFANRNEVNILDIRKAIENSKNIYPDVIQKELVNFDIKFKDIIQEEKI